MRPFILLLAAICLGAGISHAEGDSAGKIVYPRKQGEGYRLHVMNADGTGDHELPGQTALVNLFPSWSPDGKRISFMAAASVDPQQHQVCFLNADGTGLTTMKAPADRAGLAAWSPDGKTVAFSAGNEIPNIYVSGTDGSAPRKLNADGTGAVGAFWTRDGKRIGYTTIQPGGASTGQLIIVNSDGTDPQTICKDGIPLAGANALSPDGNKLLYVVMDPQGEKVNLRCWDFSAKSESFLLDMELSKGLGEFESISLPAWAPDGKSILISRKTEKGIGLFRVSADGTEQKRLTPEGIDCLAGAWAGAH